MKEASQSLNEKKEPTLKEKAILCSFAKDGPSWAKDLSDEGRKKIATYKTVLNGCHHLVSLGLVEIKKEYPQEDTHKAWMGRKKTYYGLTFHGLMYGLNIDAFTEKEAAEVRLRNFAEVPITIEPTPFAPLEQEALEFFPRTWRTELARVRLLLETHLKPEIEAYNKRIQKIVAKARQNKMHVRFFSMIEQKYSQRIYAALRRVNLTPSYYNEAYATDIFRKEFNECFMEFLAKWLKGDEKVFEEMAGSLNDVYSLAVFQKIMFPYYAKIQQKLRSLESDSDIEWLETWSALSDYFSRLSKVRPEELKNELRAGPKTISKIKAIMSKL